MADVLVTCITKPHPMSSHEHITHIGNPTANPPWRWPRDQVVRSIEARENTFYVLDPITHQRADVGVRRIPGHEPFLQTHADNDWNNNLLSLNQCPLGR